MATAGDLRLGATVAVLAPGGGGATGAVSFRWSRAPTPEPKPVAPASHDDVDDAAPLSSRARFGPLPRTLRPASAVVIATGVCGATSPLAALLLVTTADDEEEDAPCWAELEEEVTSPFACAPPLKTSRLGATWVGGAASVVVLPSRTGKSQPRALLRWCKMACEGAVATLMVGAGQVGRR